MAISLSRIIIIILLINSIFSPDLSSNNFDSDKAVLPRIGEHISKNERDYFRLFPKIENFKSADVSLNQTGEYVFAVHYDSSGQSKSRSYFLSEDIFEQLSFAIDNYEYIFDKDNGTEKIKIDWTGLIDTIIKPEFRYYSERNGKTSLVTVNGKEISGSLLWYDSTYILIDPAFSEFNWHDSDKDILVFHYSEILSIIEPYYLEIQGNGAVYKEITGSFEEKSRFLSTLGSKHVPPPPEYYQLLITKKDTFQITEFDDPEISENIIRNQASDYHITIEIVPFVWTYDIELISLILRRSEEWGYMAGSRLVTQFQFQAMKEYAPGITFEKNISDHLRLGVSWSRYTTGKIGYNLFNVKSIGNSYSLHLSYSPSAHKPLAISFKDRIHAKYFAGLLITDYFRRFYLSFGEENINEEYEEELKIEEIIIGAYAGIDLDYYITEILSFNTKVYVNIHKPVKFEEFILPIGNYRYLVIPDTKLYYAGLGIKFGLGIHF